MDVHPPATGHLGLLLFQDTTAPKNIGLGGFYMDKSLTLLQYLGVGSLSTHACSMGAKQPGQPCRPWQVREPKHGRPTRIEGLSHLMVSEATREEGWVPPVPSRVLPAPQLLTAVVVGQGTGSEPSPRPQHAVSTCPRNTNWL